MSDKFQAIRDALALNPTPGPRRVSGDDSSPYVTVALPENEGRRWDDPIICTLYGEHLQPFPNARAHAALIAACDPDTIRALLRQRDELLALVHDYRGIAEFLARRDAAAGNDKGARMMRLTCSRLDNVIRRAEGSQ